MFFVIIVVLTAGQMYFEFKITKALGLENISKRFVLVNLAFSIVITIGSSYLFGAASGMVVVSAGMLSTVLSSPMYAVYDKWTEYKPKLAKVRDSYEEHRTEINQTLSDLAKVVMIFVFIITFPFRVLRWCVAASEKLKSTYHKHRPAVHA